MHIYVHTHRDIVHSCICIDIHFKVVIYIYTHYCTNSMVSRYICHIHDIPHIYIYLYIYIHDIVTYIVITYDYILIYTNIYIYYT